MGVGCWVEVAVGAGVALGFTTGVALGEAVGFVPDVAVTGGVPPSDGSAEGTTEGELVNSSSGKAGGVTDAEDVASKSGLNVISGSSWQETKKIRLKQAITVKTAIGLYNSFNFIRKYPRLKIKSHTSIISFAPYKSNPAIMPRIEAAWDQNTDIIDI